MVREARAVHAELCAHLDALSPLRVLERGYAIALHESTGRAIRSQSEVKEGDRFRVRVSDGEFSAKVEGHE
jgi:exodeoxyribonuclease VII large subunit